MHQLPLELAVSLSSHFGLRTAVETGTYLGMSAAMLRSTFSQVFSVEISENLYRAAKARYGDIEGLVFLCGSSPSVLPDLIEKIGEPSLFWLDGHWSPGLPMGPEPQCPVLDEIRIIDRFEFNARSLILIDDASYFLGAPPPPHRREDWPYFLEIVDLLRSFYPRFVTVLDNVILAGPPGLEQVLDDYWLEVLARGADTHQLWSKAENPTVSIAAKKLVRAVAHALMPRTAQLLAKRRLQAATERAMPDLRELRSHH